MESVTGMKWNQWPGSNGMGGRNGTESMAGIVWNMHMRAGEALTGTFTGTSPLACHRDIYRNIPLFCAGSTGIGVFQRLS